MRDKRSVDELSIEELERVLAIKRRAARQEQMQRMQRTGRVVPNTETAMPRAVAPSEQAASPTPSPISTSSIPQFEDGFVPVVKRKNDTSKTARRALDRVLLLIEGSAVIGLIALGVVMLQSIGTLQDETAQAQLQAEAQIRASIPTIAPTPVLQLADVVLPGGHTISANGAQFNFEEIPVSLRGQVRDQLLMLPEMERPAVTSESARRIVIPDIGVDSVIVQGVDPEALKLGVGQLPNGVTPTSGGNLVMAAHNDIYGELFRHIVDLEPGMYFDVYTETQVYTYVVTGTEVVDPQDVHVMGNRGGATATLITCYPYQVNTQRWIVYASRVDT